MVEVVVNPKYVMENTEIANTFQLEVTSLKFSLNLLTQQYQQIA